MNAVWHAARHGRHGGPRRGTRWAGARLADLDVPVGRVGERSGEVGIQHVDRRRDRRSAVLVRVDGWHRLRRVVAHHEERAARCGSRSAGCGRHGHRAYTRSTRSAPTRGRTPQMRTDRAHSHRRGRTRCGARAARPRRTPGPAHREMSFAVTLQPCSASQTASPPSPAPTSRARPATTPLISWTSVPFGWPLHSCSPP